MRGRAIVRLRVGHQGRPDTNEVRVRVRVGVRVRVRVRVRVVGLRVGHQWG